DRLIARPSKGGSIPPHATGAAFDVTLRYVHPDLCYVPKTRLDMGRTLDTSTVAQPDYFEHSNHLPTIQVKQQRNRRALYWIMRGALLQDDSGFICNPDEWWHWSFGDQMWAVLTDAPCAYF